MKYRHLNEKKKNCEKRSIVCAALRQSDVKKNVADEYRKRRMLLVTNSVCVCAEQLFGIS